MIVRYTNKKKMKNKKYRNVKTFLSDNIKIFIEYYLKNLKINRSV